jgi:hypothetical protein
MFELKNVYSCIKSSEYWFFIDNSLEFYENTLSKTHYVLFKNTLLERSGAALCRHIYVDA